MEETIILISSFFFSTQAEFSYFSAVFRLIIFLWIFLNSRNKSNVDYANTTSDDLIVL